MDLQPLGSPILEISLSAVQVHHGESAHHSLTHHRDIYTGFLVRYLFLMGMSVQLLVTLGALALHRLRMRVRFLMLTLPQQTGQTARLESLPKQDPSMWQLTTLSERWHSEVTT